MPVVDLYGEAPGLNFQHRDRNPAYCNYPTNTTFIPACPPLIYGCKYLNFSRSKSELDLAGRRSISEMEGTEDASPEGYADPDSEKYLQMIEGILKRLNLTTLKYQRLDDLVDAIGLPKEKLCTFCWDGAT